MHGYIFMQQFANHCLFYTVFSWNQFHENFREIIFFSQQTLLRGKALDEGSCLIDIRTRYYAQFSVCTPSSHQLSIELLLSQW